MIGAWMVRARLRRFFAAVTRGDVDAVCRHLADDVAFEFPGRSHITHRYEGPDEFRAFWKRVFEHYASFAMAPTRIGLTRPYALGSSNAALVEWVADAVGRDRVRTHADGVTVFELRRGKLVHVRDYLFDPSLLDLVWGRARQPAAGTGNGGPVERLTL